MIVMYFGNVAHRKTKHLNFNIGKDTVDAPDEISFIEMPSLDLSYRLEKIAINEFGYCLTQRTKSDSLTEKKMTEWKIFIYLKRVSFAQS